MADTSKKTDANDRKRRGGPTPASDSAQARPVPRRVAARRLAEQRRQRLVIGISGGAVGLALLLVLIGIAYDQLWIPSRPVAQVGSTTLNRGDYWAERRLVLANNIVQNFQLIALFGGNPQFVQQFQGQSPQISLTAREVRSQPIDENTVTGWINRQIKDQGAQALGISVSQDEINQRIAADLAPIFVPPPIEPLTPTETLTATTEAEPAAATSDPAAWWTDCNARADRNRRADRLADSGRPDRDAGTDPHTRTDPDSVTNAVGQ
jgi:hypothetical protein